MSEPQVNPRCTGFCTTGGSLGHHPVSPSERLMMVGELATDNLAWTLAVPPEQHAQAAAVLYRYGHGYHAIADLLGLSHEEGFRLITKGA